MQHGDLVMPVVLGKTVSLFTVKAPLEKLKVSENPLLNPATSLLVAHCDYAVTHIWL